MSKCKYCGLEIFWTKVEGKNKPFSMDGDLHECEEMHKARNSLKKLAANSLTPEEIARYEKGINQRKK